jgi:hypothetical protein
MKLKKKKTQIRKKKNEKNTIQVNSIMWGKIQIKKNQLEKRKKILESTELTC